MSGKSTPPESAFTLSFTAGPADIDELGHVNNAVWVQWMERLSVTHWNEWADQADIDAYFWVVTRHEIDYRGNIREGETATGHTWVDTPPKGAQFQRNIAFFNSDGKACVRAISTWAMIDKESQRLVRVPQRLADRFMAPFG